MFRLALALVCLLGADCAVTGSRSATDDQEVVAHAVELGSAYSRQGNTIRAKENMHKALDVDPRSLQAHASLALGFQQEQEWTLAESLFEKANALDPKNSAAMNNFGAFLYAQGRAEEAIAQRQVAVSGQFYARQGQAFEQARLLDVRLDQFGSLSSRRLLLCGLVAHHFSDEARAQDCYAAMRKRYPRTDEAKRLGNLVEERT